MSVCDSVCVWEVVIAAAVLPPTQVCFRILMLGSCQGKTLYGILIHSVTIDLCDACVRVHLRTCVCVPQDGECARVKTATASFLGLVVIVTCPPHLAGECVSPARLRPAADRATHGAARTHTHTHTPQPSHTNTRCDVETLTPRSGGLWVWGLAVGYTVLQSQGDDSALQPTPSAMYPGHVFL